MESSIAQSVEPKRIQIGFVAIVAALVVAALLAATDSPVRAAQKPGAGTELAARWFMEVDGIPGESVDISHQGWIEIVSVTQGINRPGGRLGSPRFKNLTVRAELDRAGVAIAEALALRTVIPLVKIDAVTGSGNIYYQYELTDVIFTNYVIEGAATGDRPQQAMKLNFRKITVRYIIYDDRGAQIEIVEYTYTVR